MGLPWFRMYTEFAKDHLVQSLAFEDQRHFVIALCLKGEGTLDRTYGSPEDRARVIARALNLDPAGAAEANRRLRAVGLVDENWQPVNWEKRQPGRELSTDRVQRFREKNKSKKEETEKRDIEGKRTETVSETVSPFQSIRQTYPPGLYAESEWLLAEKYCLTHAENGVPWLELIAAAESYRRQCEARDSIPNFVKSPAKFYGTAAWRGPFPLPKSKAQSLQDQNVGVAQRWLDANR